MREHLGLERPCLSPSPWQCTGKHFHADTRITIHVYTRAQEHMHTCSHGDMQTCIRAYMPSLKGVTGLLPGCSAESLARPCLSPTRCACHWLPSPLMAPCPLMPCHSTSSCRAFADLLRRACHHLFGRAVPDPRTCPQHLTNRSDMDQSAGVLVMQGQKIRGTR
jgi:hypothetical protein